MTIRPAEILVALTAWRRHILPVQPQPKDTGMSI
jgi:hypothetical protein